MTAKRKIGIDLNIDEWKVAETLAFRGATSCNPEAAVSRMNAAFEEAQAEAREKWGEKIDEEGWEPPDSWMPECLMNIDPALLLGFAWVNERRKAAVTYAEFADAISYGQLLEGFYDAMMASADDAPLPNRGQRRRSAPRSKTASKSASRSAGPSGTSTS